MLVLDVADDLLHHVLDGDQPVDAAILIDDQRHVHARKPHLQQQVEHAHAGCDEQHGPRNFGQRHLPALVLDRRGEHILDVDHADDLVERTAIHRQAGMRLLRHQVQDLVQWRHAFDGDDVGTRHHDIVHRDGADRENALDQLPFPRLDRLLAFFVLLDQLFERLANAGPDAAAVAEPLQPPSYTARLALLRGGIGARRGFD